VVEHFCSHEWAVHLDDVMIRRTSWRYYHSDHLTIAHKVADWMGELLAWDDATKTTELARYEKLTQKPELPGPPFAHTNGEMVARAGSASKTQAASNEL